MMAALNALCRLQPMSCSVELICKRNEQYPAEVDWACRSNTLQCQTSLVIRGVRLKPHQTHRTAKGIPVKAPEPLATPSVDSQAK